MLEQVTNFNYVGCDVTHSYNLDVKRSANMFQNLCETTSIALKEKIIAETMLIILQCYCNAEVTI
jgi:hypothetical protein